MNILFLSSNRGQLFGLNLRKPLHLLSLMVLLGMLMAASVYIGYTLNPNQDNQALIDEWRADVHRQQVQLTHIREEADANIDALSSRIGLLQAHVMRLDALGQKLVHMASIDTAEFDFDNTPAIGGPETVYNKGLDPNELSQAIEQLSYELETRENQLAVLENYVLNENLQKEVQPSGRPISKGWISSYYGMRTHPLSGRREMHKGIDFAGKLGGPVNAVAKGVVTYAGKRYGYGNVIDIAHGNGYTTRYAHNSRLLVSVGDTVEKGFQIAEIGSSGRSTGPHVHFEVLKNGREINPVKFIRAAN
ncbi:MAG: M23 family metallopeptidase [Gammaproteobacteria bacterium]|nr:M23 family metallopeptidase [Gammaproteobacteria bacterium]MDH3449038.1 M23 family metallopeptidase [Gammaproteobacteria bacterium]